VPPERIKVLLVCNREIHDWHLTPENLDRLRRFADLEWLEASVAGFDWVSVPEAPEVTARIAAGAGDADAILVCHGAPPACAPLIVQVSWRAWRARSP
jgi:hypothetical protein